MGLNNFTYQVYSPSSLARNATNINTTIAKKKKLKAKKVLTPNNHQHVAIKAPGNMVLSCGIRFRSNKEQLRAYHRAQKQGKMNSEARRRVAVDEIHSRFVFEVQQ